VVLDPDVKVVFVVLDPGVQLYLYLRYWILRTDIELQRMCAQKHSFVFGPALATFI
jgi:hypothetical protein